MNVFKVVGRSLGKALGKVGGLLKQAWHLAEKAGLDDELLGFTLKYIRIADSRYVDNAQRREWVVSKVAATGINESLARLAVELAFSVYRAEKRRLGV